MKENSHGSPDGITEDGRRRRTTSGPQKSTHLTYNDTLQHYPIPPLPTSINSTSTSPFRPGSNLPPGAMLPTSFNQQAGMAASNGNVANGYHPYRRTTKGSDASSSPIYFGSAGPGGGPPILPLLPGQPPIAATSIPPYSQRIRSSSTTSNVTAREASRSAASVPVSYSSAVSGQTRAPAVQQPSQRQAGLGHLRNSPQLRPTVPATAQRPDMTNRSESGRSDRSVPLGSSAHPPANHQRTDSTSSTHSATDRSQRNTSPGGSSERSGTTATTNTSSSTQKKPSPLSKESKQAGNHDDDSGAVYGGSDDEDTIKGRSTPTPGDKTKKGSFNKLRKALSFSTLTEIQQAEAAAAAPDRAYGGRNNVAYKRAEGHQNSSVETNGSSGSARSTSPPRTPDNGAPPLPGSSGASISSRRSTRPPLSGADGSSKRSLFNRKFNSSTDNISISSTVSSASVMLRKVGNLGKIARRRSLMGLTNMFNKDKDPGREGLHDDDFGTIVPPEEVVAADEAAQGGKTSKKEKTKTKKGAPALASVSHATVELETSSAGADSSMTPAASYVRQHQLQMKQQAEADRIAREAAEAERLAAAQRNAKTTDDVTESRQKMIEKEKERLKSKRGWRKKLGVGSIGSASEARQTTGLETMPVEEEAVQSRSRPFPPSAMNANAGQLGPGPPTPYSDNNVDSTYDEEELEPPQMPGATEGYESSGDDYETDSLRHWGEGIERSRESASRVKSVKGILKNTPSMGERGPLNNSPSLPMSGSVDKPFAGRLRANSYDAPQASATNSGTVPLMSQISTTPAATDRVDGMPRASASEEERPRASNDRNAVPPASNSTSFGHHANSSMPTLSLMMNPSPTGQRSVTAPVTRKRLVFADAHIYHSTWPAHVYDRRGELATCNRLTPLLAQRIKEELNTYKMEEMAVAPSSRIHTHFFV